MTTIETLNNGESGLSYRTKNNNNFANLNNDKQEVLLEGAFVDGDKTKLDGIETGAEVNTVDSINAQTGAVVLDKTDIGLSNVDNTSDTSKPVSTATQTALNGKEDTFTKNTAFNKNFGTTAGTVAEGAALEGKQDALGYNPLQDVVAGTNVTIDKTDPLNPIINSTGGGGSGDVVGPASSTDGAVALFDGITGKLLQDSAKTIVTTLGGDDTTVPTSKAVADAIGAGGGGDMLKAVYDPQTIEGDAFARANHTGTQTMSTISDAGALATLNTVGTTEIDDRAVTFGKVETIPTNRILGRDTAGTGDIEALTIPNFKSMVSLDNVDNTSDANKPISTATQTALDGKLDSVVGGTNVTIDNTDPNNPIINASGGGGGGGGLRETIQIAGTQIVNTILYEGAIASASTLSAGYITLLTAPTGSSFIVSVSKSTDSGATYGAAETVTLTATNKYVKGTLTLAFAEGDFMKIEVTQIGSGVAGADLLFTVTGS